MTDALVPALVLVLSGLLCELAAVQGNGVAAWVGVWIQLPVAKMLFVADGEFNASKKSSHKK